MPRAEFVAALRGRSRWVETITRWIRTVAVMGFIVVAGGIFGSIAGTLTLLPSAIRLEGLAVFSNIENLVDLGIISGGFTGAVLGPLVAWVLMRNVPLWLAIGGTTLGTSVSGGLVLLLTNNLFGGMLASIFGFMATAAHLYDRFPAEDQRRIEP